MSTLNLYNKLKKHKKKKFSFLIKYKQILEA